MPCITRLCSLTASKLQINCKTELEFEREGRAYSDLKLQNEIFILLEGGGDKPSSCGNN